MGLIRRPAMPLLTTLAALVIIVHCVEEDLETDYRYYLKPRILDTETRKHEQPWRIIEEEEKPRHENNWEAGSPDASPKRRRPGRKRKRRPQTAPNEDDIPQERIAYPDIPPRPYYDVDFENVHQTTELPKRRRKKPEARPIRWIDDDVMVVERPLRKNGGRRRKRPSLTSGPELSEFRDTANLNQEQVDTELDANPHEIIAEKVFGYNRDITNQKKSYDNYESIAAEDGKDTEQNPITADKSLSEFSMELISKPKINEDYDSPNYESRINIPKSNDPLVTESQHYKTTNRELEEHKIVHDNRLRNSKRKKKKNHEAANENVEAVDKMDMNYLKFLISKHDPSLREEIASAYNTHIPNFENVEQLKSGLKVRFNGIDDTRPKDQLSLKDILKKSNGTSLSEILQQHNLSLSDLLHGKEHAVSLLKSKDILNNKPSSKADINEDSREQTLINLDTESAPESITDNCNTTEPVQKEFEVETVPTTTVKALKDNATKVLTTRRHPLALRKKLRIRPINNTTNTFKGQLSRDLITLNSRRYSNFRRNVTKSRQWKDIIPPATRNNTRQEINNTLIDKTTTEIIPEETTISTEITSHNSSYEDMRPQLNTDIKLDDINMDTTVSTVTELVTEMTKNFTEKLAGIVTMPRPTAVSSGLRRQAFNNRLKRKRLKNKTSTTELPQDDIIKHLFGMGNLVSSSEFIAQTQEPKLTEDESTELSTLDDFITTESTSITDGHTRLTNIQTTTPQSIKESTTEEAAKIEIEEIFSDNASRAKLSKILKERNMTLSELVELRERGSSHIHLADIFHNASREPNPAEPFLSKSLLEPISKETYPLRAILEANLHDPNGRVTTIDPNVNIPVVMDFRNNVNENAENMGIMSLFNNISKNVTRNRTSIESEQEHSTVHSVPNVTHTTQSVGEGRVLDEIQDDIVSWNEIFSIMDRTDNNEIQEATTGEPIQKIILKDSDGDGLIALEDLERLTDLDNNIAAAFKENLAIQADTVEKGSGILENIPSHTKSVTVATASIAGLAMIVFLLTYATYKWKQQKSMIRNRSFCDERIPSPVFENRKGHKNNSSTRSISPMIQTSNIYTLNTLDSQNGKESPDYMWDSLRKPFQ